MPRDSPWELRRAVELMEKRGFKTVETGSNFALMELRRMRALVIYPLRDYLQLSSIDDVIKEFMLDKADSIVVVSERPYYLSDELNSAIERANLSGRTIGARVYPVYAGDIDGQLNVTMGIMLANNYDKVGNSDEADGQCPSCGEPMRVVFDNHVMDEGEESREQVLVCKRCGLKIHRFIHASGDAGSLASILHG
ncbi:hypothetical protein GCM10007981_05200 [Thermocladium modestius]|uniref:Uncharacterized protein n=1 Tax=Thermocladium modestius TaxID=62609 RepID=A0A830GSW1_9CREN|nr:hypothetical protein [Thermocladium modestius]GGP19850.1 hypothetical protein GCM10007981_05200 [Thermocladium modestius]